MAYRIENGQAFVPVKIDKQSEDGKPQVLEGDIVLRKLKVREWAYSLDEFMAVKPEGGVNIKIGAMLMSTFPKSIVKAPFEIKDNNSVMDAILGLGDILEITSALMELNGLGGETSKK